MVLAIRWFALFTESAGKKGSGPLLSHLFPASAKKWSVKTLM